MSTYDLSIFINCPFDGRYRSVFHAITFAVYDCGFLARSALELDNAGQNRLDKIVRIVAECKYGIHDISRTQPDRNTRLPRFNMPFELGIDLGCSRYGSKRQRNKRLLVLDIERYRYQKFLSDIGGNDIHAHNDSPEIAIACVRNWLRTHLPKGKTIPGAAAMWNRYGIFTRELPQFCKRLNLQIAEMQFSDYVTIVEFWLKSNP